ncbi:MAG: WXG100 family type VII secretion target [Herpetosiphon sp.]|nr:WXG100 family type VII secretion target [Herpetosiphon sp.]
MDEVKASYDQLEQLAGRFSNQSQAIQQMLQNLKNVMAPLRDGDWIGRGSDAFFAEMESEVLPATQRLQKALDDGNEVTKTIVQQMQQAEQEASNIFKNWRA